MSPPRPWLQPVGHPERTAVQFAGRAVSRFELASRAASLATWLRTRGILPGATVACSLPNGLDFVTLVHAVDRLDAVLLPLNTRQTASELEHPLREARARLVLHAGTEHTRAVQDAATLAGDIPVLALPDGFAAAPQAGRIETSASSPLAVLYTSGTAGKPKGAILTHANFLASARASARHLGVARDDRWLACLPLFHVGGLSILLRSALDAIPIVLHPGFDPEAVSTSLEKDDITLVSLVPTMLARLLEVRGERPAPPRLRCVLLGGGPAAPALLERAEKLGYPLAPTYGLTEATSQVATKRPDSQGEGLEPLPGTEVRIEAASGHQTRAGEGGEILVRGETVMRGYIHRPEETRRVLRNGWLHTGDIGRLDCAGRLHVLDRRSDLIVSGGENIYPAEVESVLAEHPDVLEAGVSGAPDPEFGSRPEAWLVVASGLERVPADLDRFCRDRLAGYKVPARFHLIDALPRTASGKLQRRKLSRSNR